MYFLLFYETLFVQAAMINELDAFISYTFQRFDVRLAPLLKKNCWILVIKAF